MQAFHIETLSPEQVRAVYPVLLAPAFPENELKPLSMIEQALKRGEYLCFGAMDGDRTLAVAFFVRIGDGGDTLMLLDYLAVSPGLRCRGIGGRFLQTLIDGPLRGIGTVLLEVDEPAAAESPEDLEIRRRRLDFYLRNGLKDSGVLAEVYGATYRILTLPTGEAPCPDAVRRMYDRLYRAILPPHLFCRWVSIRGV